MDHLRQTLTAQARYCSCHPKQGSEACQGFVISFKDTGSPFNHGLEFAEGNIGSQKLLVKYAESFITKIKGAV